MGRSGHESGGATRTVAVMWCRPSTTRTMTSPMTRVRLDASLACAMALTARGRRWRRSRRCRRPLPRSRLTVVPSRSSTPCWRNGCRTVEGQGPASGQPPRPLCTKLRSDWGRLHLVRWTPSIPNWWRWWSTVHRRNAWSITSGLFTSRGPGSVSTTRRSRCPRCAANYTQKGPGRHHRGCASGRPGRAGRDPAVTGDEESGTAKTVPAHREYDIGTAPHRRGPAAGGSAGGRAPPPPGLRWMSASQALLPLLNRRARRSTAGQEIDGWCSLKSAPGWYSCASSGASPHSRCPWSPGPGQQYVLKNRT